MPFGSQDWNFLSDRNFGTIRVFLDLADVTSEEDYLEMYNIQHEHEEKDDTSNRNTFIGNFFRGTVAGISARLMLDRKKNDAKKPKKEYTKIDENQFNFVDVMLAMNNISEIQEII